MIDLAKEDLRMGDSVIIVDSAPKQWSALKIEDWAINSGWVKKEVLLKWLETNNPPMSEPEE